VAQHDESVQSKVKLIKKMKRKKKGTSLSAGSHQFEWVHTSISAAHKHLQWNKRIIL